MTLKVEDPPLVLTTLNEEWANKMQNISEMLNSNKERRGEEESKGQRIKKEGLHKTKNQRQR